jgi:hypothetical protein
MQPPEQTSFTGSIASLDKIDAYKKQFNKNKLMKCITDKSQHSQQIMYLLNT